KYLPDINWFHAPISIGEYSSSKAGLYINGNIFCKKSLVEMRIETLRVCKIRFSKAACGKQRKE
ncbi:MAG: hypothetical protein D6816_09485, partial [Bacteroidetes bacterium]